MHSTQDSLPASSEPTLPSGFHTIEQIRDPTVFSNDVISSSKAFVSVVGFAVDYREPCSTRGSDWKCTFRLMDHSANNENSGIEVTVFWPKEKMPVISNAADVVLIRDAKVQMRNGVISLLANKTSQFHILSASEVPERLNATVKAPWKSYTVQGKIVAPSVVETAYVVQANINKMDIDIPSDHEFRDKVAQSANVKNKFSLLQDVQNGKFYDVLGEVRRVFEGTTLGLTVYLTDYTNNAHFYNHVWGEHANKQSDEYGYKKKKPLKNEQPWPGPYGKMCIQMTLYDAHADFVRENVKDGQWVLIKNVQIKFGNAGTYLEGFLRGDRSSDEGQVRVEVMEASEDPEQNDLRWVAAIRRKAEYEKKFKTQLQAIRDDAASTGDKRKRDNEETGRKNGKQRRKEKRAAARRKAEEADMEARKLDLNQNIICGYPEEPILPLSNILNHRELLHGNDQEHFSPFTICKYRANVRVVDYFPHKLEDFSVGYRSSEFELLSDYSGNEDTDFEEELRMYRSGKGFKKDTWEWRFALQVEDASTKDSKERLWLIVDNPAAQQLLGLDDDATSLRQDKQLLFALREQLFKLWGDLEEQKSATLPVAEPADAPTSTFDSTASSPPPIRRAGDQPDADNSDCENIDSVAESSRVKTAQESAAKDRIPEKLNLEEAGENSVAFKNKPFTCCIKQYGIKVQETDPRKADAGNGERWQRMFGLFGTQIT